MKTIHYLSHTHWDREWLRSSDASRIKLVYLFDRLIEIMNQDETYTYFTFDGQTAAIEDYLSIKPYQKEKIEKLVSDKRLFIGPWYTQPDMFLASGESLIRNLLIGSNIAESLGHCMRVGWIPDAFGQIEKTPQLFKAIGADAIFAWRGFDYDKINDSIFMWDTAQKDSMLCVHFPLGYGYYRYLPRQKTQAIQDISQHVQACENRFKDGQILFMGGSDYAHMRSELPITIEEVKDDLNKQGYQIKLANPESYIDDVKKAINEHSRDLQHYQGEARSAALGRIHAGISSTRIDIKNQMKRYEIVLAQIVEPMCMINSYNGGDCAQELINYYWKILFKNQFHDSAYSSSPESVNQNVENRLLNLRHGLQELIWLNMRYFQTSLDLSTLSEKEDLLMLCNTLAYKRKDLAFISMIVEQDTFVIKDEHEQLIPFVRLQQNYPVNNEIEYYNGINNFHDGGEILEGSKKRVQLLLDAAVLPAMGYQAYKICYDEVPDTMVSGDVRKIDAYSFENEYLRVHIQANGSLSILNKESNESYHDVHYFEEKGDDGDEYNYSPPIHDVVQTTLTSKPRVECMEESRWFIMYRITHVLKTPNACIQHKRAQKLAESTITTFVSLRKNSHTVDFHTIIDNHAKDHMIRVILKDNHKAKKNISQDHFGITKRWNAIQKQRGIQHGATEEELPIYPMQRYVKLDHDKEMFACISKGPCEYEIYDNQKIAVTLLRSVGKFGKADLKIRPGRSSGYRLDTPSSQLLKKVVNSYSLFIKHDGSMEELARETNVINTEVQTRFLNQLSKRANKGLPWNVNNLILDEGLEIMAFKKSEDGNFQILRLLNTSLSLHKQPMIELTSKIAHCYLSDVKETIHEELCIQDNKVILPDMEGQSFITLILK